MNEMNDKLEEEMNEGKINGKRFDSNRYIFHSFSSCNTS